jgi:hypothetical protein
VGVSPLADARVLVDVGPLVLRRSAGRAIACLTRTRSPIPETDVASAWNLRGDPRARQRSSRPTKTALGVPLPSGRMRAARAADAGALLCLGPRSWLFVAGRPAASGAFDIRPQSAR